MVTWHHWILACADPLVSGHSGTTCSIHKVQERGRMKDKEGRGTKTSSPHMSRRFPNKLYLLKVWAPSNDVMGKGPRL